MNALNTTAYEMILVLGILLGFCTTYLVLDWLTKWLADDDI